jgi:RimJ/RimL family protein N-acetyltransferase
LATVDTRRLIRGRAAKDNLASLRVLEKCGFKVVGQDRGYANARREEIDELVLRLD